ncbi:MAG: hypothetical protein AAF497_21410, partial [Planctomycetota bacterium]
ATGHLSVEDATISGNSTRGGVSKFIEFACNFAVDLLESVVFAGLDKLARVPVSDIVNVAQVLELSARSTQDDAQNATIVKGAFFGLWDPCPQSKGSGGQGGGAFAYTMDVRGSTITGNYTGVQRTLGDQGINAHGGALFATREMIVDDSDFINNQTRVDRSRGGAIAVGKGIEVGEGSSKRTIPAEMRVTNSRFLSNSVRDDGSFGGAIYGGKNSVVTLTNSLFDGNHTYDADAGSGGAVFAASGSQLTITGSTFKDNYTTNPAARGGAIAGDYVSIANSVLTGNEVRSTDRGGGGGAVFGSTIRVSESIFRDNISSSDRNYNGDFLERGGGGAIYSKRDLTILSSEFSGNETTGDEAGGGAVYAFRNAKVYSSTFYDNYARDDEANGGAVYVGGNLRLENSSVIGNGAGGNGGGIFGEPFRQNFPQFGQTVTLSGSVVNGNIAGEDGDDVHATHLNIERTSIAGNFQSDIVADRKLGRTPIHRSPERTFTQTVNWGFEGESNSTGRMVSTNRVAGCDGSIVIGCSGVSIRQPQLLSSLASLNLLQETKPGNVVTTTLEFDNSLATTTLREAIDFAEANAENSVRFDESLAGGTLRITDDIEFTTDITIIGPQTGRVTLDARQGDRIFDFGNGPATDSSDLTLKNLVLANGKRAGDGGTIQFDSTGTLTLENTLIQNSSTTAANAEGGAISASFGQVVLNDSRISGAQTTGTNSEGG